MPFSQAPVIDTYSTHRLSVVQTIQAYAADPVPGRGSYIENLIPIKLEDAIEKGELVADNRLGARMHSITTDGTGTNPAIPLGVYVWEKTIGSPYYFHVEAVNGNLNVWTSTDNVTYTNVNSYAWTDLANTRRVGFTEFIDGSNNKSLVMVDGINGYVFTSNAAGTKITNSNFPSPHLATPVFLDGYVFLAKRGTGDVYNSDLNSPSNWTAGNFLSAEMYPDDLKALVKINNYILAVGQQSCEFFQDVGNSPGSPLGRIDGAVLPFGTNNPESIAFTKDSCILLANSSDGGMSLKHIEGFKFKDITPPWLVTTFNYYNNTGNCVVFGNFQRQYGQQIYSLSFTNNVNYQINVCTAVALTSDIWFTLRNGENSWWMMHTTTGPSTNPNTFFSGYSIGRNKSLVGNLYVSGSSSSPVNFTDIAYTNGSSVTQDFSSTYTIVIQTPKIDFGTVNRKAMHRFSFKYDIAVGQSTASTMSSYNRNVSVYWTDYDSLLPRALNTAWPYQASMPLYATSGNTPDNGGWGGDDPFITQLGMFRQRNFSLVYGNDSTGTLPPYYPIRVKYVEFDINKGQQ